MHKPTRSFPTASSRSKKWEVPREVVCTSPLGKLGWFGNTGVTNDTWGEQDYPSWSYFSVCLMSDRPTQAWRVGGRS